VKQSGHNNLFRSLLYAVSTGNTLTQFSRGNKQAK